MENMYKFNVYPLSEADGGGYYAEVPELPGCMASASTLEDTINLLKEAIESWIQVTEEKGKKVPNPSFYEESMPSGRFSVRISKSSHRKLLEIADKENESLNGIVSKFLDQMIAFDSIDNLLESKYGKEQEQMKIVSPNDLWSIYNNTPKLEIVVGGKKSA